MTIHSRMATKLRLNRVKSALVDMNRTGKDLAKHLGKTEATISRWCTNDVQPSIEMLYEISKYLKVDIRDLLVSTAK